MRRLVAWGQIPRNLDKRQQLKEYNDMRIENIAGEYAIVDSSTGKPVAGEQRYRQLNFAEERLRLLKDAARPVERARDDDGHFVADDPDTPENEAYEGGKAPAKKKKPAKKKATKKKVAKK